MVELVPKVRFAMGKKSWGSKEEERCFSRLLQENS